MSLNLVGGISRKRFSPKILIILLSLGACLCGVVTPSASLSAASEKRLAPKAITPQQFADYYLKYCLLPRIGEIVSAVPPSDQASTSRKLDNWAAEIHDAIVDFESIEITPEIAASALRADGYDDAVINSFNSKMSGLRLGDKAETEQQVVATTQDLIAASTGQSRANASVVRDMLRKWAYSRGEGSVDPDEIEEMENDPALGHQKFLNRLDYLFGPGQPVDFPKPYYLFVRDDLASGTLSYVATVATEQAKNESGPVPSDSVTSAPLAGVPQRSFPTIAGDVIIGSPLLQGKLPAGDGSSSAAATYDNPNSGFEPGSLLDNFATGIESAGRAAGLKAGFLVKVDSARKEFFDLYPDKPGIEEARSKLADLLAQIDLYYLSMFASAGMSDAEIRRISALDLLTGGRVGHGLQPSAEAAFSRWVDAAREAMGASPRDPMAGKVNVMTGQPIPDAPQRVVECTKQVISCVPFVPTPLGYAEGIAASKDYYAYYVAVRDRAELSAAKHIALSELPPPAIRPPAPHVSGALKTQEIVAFEESALGTNNSAAASSMGSILPNGEPKMEAYEQVVDRIKKAGKYRTLNCTYEDGARVYHFWSGSVPPYFSQLTYAVMIGGMIGDAARLGTKPTVECPPNEQAAKNTELDLLNHLARPNPGQTPPEEEILPLTHDFIGAIAPGYGGTYVQNTVAPILRDEFKAEVDTAIASKQQVLQCDYPALGQIQHIWLWYKEPPSNVKEMLKRIYLYNGAMAHMGTSGRASCPETLREAKEMFSQLTAESGPFLSRQEYDARVRKPN
jgi:hypothetical protein